MYSHRSMTMFSTKMTHSSHLIREDVLPYLHPAIVLNNFSLREPLLTQSEINTIKSYFSRHPCIIRYKFYSSQINSNVTVVKINKRENENEFEIYAMHFGEKRNLCLGYGSYGVAKLSQNLETGEWCVLKVQKKLSIAEKKLYLNEVDTLAKLNLLLGQCSRNDKPHDLIFMKLIEGMTLANFMFKKSIRPIGHWLLIARNICEAVSSLHNLGKIHGDIKPDNIMVDPATYDVALIDFGSSLRADIGTYSTLISAFNYASPEQMHMCKYGFHYPYNVKTDAYALAINLAKMFDLSEYTSPSDLFHPDDITLKYNNKLPNKKLRDEVIHFLNQMTHDEPDKRPAPIEAVCFFDEKIRNIVSDDISNTQKVAIISLDDWFAHIKGCSKHAFYQALEKMDVVWFIDKKNEYQNYYPALRRELVLHNICIGRKLFSSIDAGVSEIEILRHISNQQSTYPKKYFFVTTKKLSTELVISLEQSHIDVVSIDEFESELKAKYECEISISHYQSFYCK